MQAINEETSAFKDLKKGTFRSIFFKKTPQKLKFKRKRVHFSILLQLGSN